MYQLLFHIIKKKLYKKTINSIINQTYKKLEIIIIYDDENHSDLQFIKKLKSQDKRIKLIINTKSLGAGISRNIGISSAKENSLLF